VLDFDTELENSTTEVQRVLKVRWWNDYTRTRPSVLNTDPDWTKIDDSQLTKAVVYHALAFHICPKLTQFSGGEPDKFQVMMQFYQGRFEHEMDLVLREGVRYDVNDDSTFERAESLPTKTLRMVR
jgi:hypothetical protein